MPQPMFFERALGLTAREIVALTGAEPASAFDLSLRVCGVAAIETAGPDDLVFLDNVRYAEHLADTEAGLCILGNRFRDLAPPHLPVLVARKPFQAFVAVARELHAASLVPGSLFASTGISEGAHVHPSARVETGAIVDPGAVIGPKAEIGARTIVGAGAVIGPSVTVGRDCRIGAGVSLSHAMLGDRVIIHPGCRLGQDGFGYQMGPKHTKLPQVGRVIIQDDVEIGANTTIDRGFIRDTVVGEGTKIDNLVQVGHNVVIGRHCVIVAQTGISGSVTLEDYVALGARVGVNNHLTIGEGAQIAAISVVHGDVPPGARWGGTPAKPARQWFREMLTLERLAARDEGSRKEAEGEGDSAG